MFAKFKKKNHEPQSDVSRDDTSMPDFAQGTSTNKMNFKGPEVVLVGGLVLIVGGMFWFMSGGLDHSTVSSTKSNHSEKTNTSKEEKPPFVYENTMQKQSQEPAEKREESPKEVAPKAEAVEAKDKAPFVYENSTDFGDDTLEPPPPSYEQNNTALAKKVPKVEEVAPAPVNTQTKNRSSSQEIVANSVSSEVVSSQKETPVTQEQTKQEPKATVDTTQEKVEIAKEKEVEKGTYVCRIVEDYANMLGKEIMYYVKDKKSSKYTPAYAVSNWDESGILVKKRFVATQVDVPERMVEVHSGKWIPALEFMTCTLVEESMR